MWSILNTDKGWSVGFLNELVSRHERKRRYKDKPK